MSPRERVRREHRLTVDGVRVVVEGSPDCAGRCRNEVRAGVRRHLRAGARAGTFAAWGYLWRWHLEDPPPPGT